jgi:hypothetical protein
MKPTSSHEQRRAARDKEARRIGRESGDLIVMRCQDLELDLSDAPGGGLDHLARKMSELQLKSLLRELDYLSRAEPDPRVRRRYSDASDMVKRRLEAIDSSIAELDLLDLARIARDTGRETCTCGESHVEGGPYYVTVVDGKRYDCLSGPYRTHAEALAMVEPMQRRALDLESAAAFYSFGTALLPRGTTKKGILD